MPCYHPHPQTAVLGNTIPGLFQSCPQSGSMLQRYWGRTLVTGSRDESKQRNELRVLENGVAPGKTGLVLERRSIRWGLGVGWGGGHLVFSRDLSDPAELMSLLWLMFFLLGIRALTRSHKS